MLFENEWLTSGWIVGSWSNHADLPRSQGRPRQAGALKDRYWAISNGSYPTAGSCGSLTRNSRLSRMIVFDSWLLRFMSANHAPCDEWFMALDLHKYIQTSSEPSINVTPNSVVTLKSSMPCQAKYRWTLRNQWGLWRRREARASFSIHESPHCGKDVCKFKSLLAPTFKKISLIPRNGLHTTDVAHYTGPSKPWAPLSPVEENALRPWLIMMEEQ